MRSPLLSAPGLSSPARGRVELLDDSEDQPIHIAPRDATNRPSINEATLSTGMRCETPRVMTCRRGHTETETRPQDEEPRSRRFCGQL